MHNFIMPADMAAKLNELRDIIYGYNLQKGWHDKPREFGTDCALIHSEVSEALEGDRKQIMDDHLPNRPMPEVEFGDAIIRLMDTSGKMKFDIGGAVVEKFEYNKLRKDHTKEVRALQGGKQY